MRTLITLIAFVLPAIGQDVTSVLDYQTLIYRAPATVLTMTASQGDGTICTVGKVASSTIYFALSCTNATGSEKTTVVKATGATATTIPWGLGDVLCFLQINPTATAIAAAGSWSAIPAVGIGWQCSTQIRTAGTVSGQTPLVAGAIAWP